MSIGHPRIINHNLVWDVNSLTWVAMTQPTSGGGGGTVDQGTGGLSPWLVTAASLPLPTGAATAALQTQPGVDIGDVTINNASGASAVNVQDGGNSLTVDGSVTVTQATGTNLHAVIDSGTITTITNVVHVDDNSGSLTIDNPTLSVVGGGVEATALRVTIATDSTGVLSVDDNGGSLTVDGTVAVSNFPATQVVTGNKTNNSAVPGATNLGTLPAVATAASPSYTEGNQVALSTDLAGQVRITGSISASSSADVVLDNYDPYTAGQTGKNLTQTPQGRLRVDADELNQFNTITLVEVLKEIRNELRVNNYLLRVGFEGKINELRVFDTTATFDPLVGGMNVIRIDDFLN